MAEQNQEPTNSSHSMFFQDSAIDGRVDDVLGREPFARLVAVQLRASPGSMVFGLIGSWGSGKTSVVNMVAEILNETDSAEDTQTTETSSPSPETDESTVILRFDPGLFSGTEQLVEHFFEELGAQFVETEDSRLQSIGKLMSDYGPMLGSLRFLPVIGNVIGGMGDFAGHAGNQIQGDSEPPPSINKKRKDLKQALADQPRPVIVIIDDLDRLQSEEIRDMVKLVRLNADFPNTTYLLCYDRERVERALGATDLFSEDESKSESPTTPTNDRMLSEGRAYLEKIVQLTYEVPHLRDSDLSDMLAEGLTKRLDEVGRASRIGEEVTVDQERLREIVGQVVKPLLKSLRDVKRYLNILPAAFQQTYNEVAAEDVIALEAIRIQLPSLHSRISDLSQALTQIAPPAHSAASRENRKVEDEYKRRVRDFVEAAGEGNREVAEHFVSQVFPAAARHLGGYTAGPADQQKWRRERRVADQGVLTTYLLKQVPSGGVPTPEVVEIITAANDRSQLSELLNSKDPESLETLVGRIRDYAEVLEEDKVGPLIEVFLNHLSRMRADSADLLGYSPDHRVLGLVRDLLRRVADEDERGRVVEGAVENIIHIGAKLELTDMVSDSVVDTLGDSVEPDERLVSEEQARTLDELALDYIVATCPEALVTERKPSQILADAIRADKRLGSEHGRGATYVEHALDNDDVMFEVLEACLGNRYVLGGGGRDRAEVTFQPGSLTGLIGEEAAAERVRELAMRVHNGELRPDPQSRRALAIALAAEHFDVRPGDSDGE